MNRLVRSTLVAATLALTSVGAAHAKDNPLLDKVFDKCIEQFVSGQFAGYDGKIKVRRKIDADFPIPLALVGQDFVISAVDSASGATLARATCKVSRDSKERLVVSIESTTTSPTKIVKTVAPAAAKLGGDAS